MNPWQSHVVKPAKSVATVLYLEWATPVEMGDIIGLQSGEEVLVTGEPEWDEPRLWVAVPVMRGFRDIKAKPVKLLDACWFVEKLSPTMDPSKTKHDAHMISEDLWCCDRHRAMSVTPPLRERPGDQPLPEVNDSEPVQDQVCAYIQRRKQVGIERYGTPLQAHNGRDALQDLFEELIDAVQYLGQVLIERDGKLP